jgi:serine/threonine protein phosphatase 1
MKILISLAAKQKKPNIWAISDIHGCYDELKKLLEKIKFKDRDTLYLLGDYVDRGPKSKQVLDFAMSKHNVHCLIGNHDYLMVRAYYDASFVPAFMQKGGRATLDSFKVDDIKDVPIVYIKWLENLPHYYKVDRDVLTHAGVDTTQNKPLKHEGAKEFMMENRNPLVPYNKKRIIHGHRPQKFDDIKENKDGKIVCIDGGCARGGKLVAFNVNSNKIVSIECKGYA